MSMTDRQQGLLSKQRHISRHMGKTDKDSKSKGPKASQQRSAEPGGPETDYKFYTSEDAGEEHRVRITNWLQVLGQSPSSERLDLWLKPDVPALVVSPPRENNPPASPSPPTDPAPTSSDNIASSSSTAMNSSAALSTPTAVATPVNNASQTVGSPSDSKRSSQHDSIEPVFLPFLLWPIIDDLGDDDPRGAETRAGLKLTEVYNHVTNRYSHILRDFNGKQLFIATTTPNTANISPAKYTADEVFANLQKTQIMLTDDHMAIATGLVEQCQGLIESFTPSGSYSTATATTTVGGPSSNASASPVLQAQGLTEHDAVQLYWSFVGGIINVCFPAIGCRVKFA
jgi:hypothetical protein